MMCVTWNAICKSSPTSPTFPFIAQRSTIAFTFIAIIYADVGYNNDGFVI